MERFWSKLAVELGKRAGLVSVMTLIVTLALGFGITQLKFATGQDSYLNKDEQTYKDNVEYQTLFGGQAMITFVQMNDGHKVDELLTGDNARKWQEISERLATVDGVDGVVTPFSVIEYSSNMSAGPDRNPATSLAGRALTRAIGAETDEALKKLRSDNFAEEAKRALQVPEANRVAGDPAWNDYLLHNNDGSIREALKVFFPNEQHTQMIVRLKGNMDIEQEGEAARRVEAITKDLAFDNATVRTTGAPILLRDLNDYLTGGMLQLGGIAVGVMVVILLLFFDVRWRLLPLLVVLVGVIWAFGLAGYLGIPLTVVTIAGLPVMLGVGIDYAIQMHARVEEEVIIDHSDHPIQETARNLCPALLVVTFDAIFAFAALRFAKVPMIRDFGLLLAVGIAAICLGSIILPLAALGIREYRKPTKARDFREGALGRFVVKVGSLPPKTALPMVVASIVIFFGGAVVEEKLVIETDPSRWVNQSSEVIKNLRTLEAGMGFNSELGVYMSADDVLSDDNVAFADSFTDQLLARFPGRLSAATSFVNSLGDVIDVPGASQIPPTAAEMKEALTLIPEQLRKAVISADGKHYNIVFAAGGDFGDRTDIIEEIRDATTPTGTSVTPSGLAAVGVGLLENLESNRILLTYLSIAFVFIFLAFRMRSIVRSLLSLVPVLIAVGLASIVAWLAGWRLSPMTAVGGPLVIAACTEFTSLILLRFVEERARGLSPQAAVDVAAARTGRAFIVSGMTAIAGVAVIAFSSLPLLRDFGLIVAMNVAVALFSALVVLPPMLVWADQRNLVSRGMVPPHVLAAANRTTDFEDPAPDLATHH